MTELSLTSRDIQALRAMGVSAGQPDRRRPDDLACMLKEKMDGMTFTYEREIGRILDERDRWKVRWEMTYGLLMALVAGVLWYAVGRMMDWAL